MRKIVLVSLMLWSTILLGKDCEIISSQLEANKIHVGGTTWRGQTMPIVNSTDYKYTPFLDAYSGFDSEVRKNIQESTCKKNGWNGVQNYKITWQITDKIYNFIATYDYFEYK